MNQNLRMELLQALRSCLPPCPGIAVLHSSLADLAPPSGFSKWDVLYCLDMLSREGWTIALPAFTLSFCQGKSFHAHRSASETGVLADWVLQEFPEAIRTRHPIYSFICIGPEKERINSCPMTTTFGSDSAFALFETADASIVMLGANWFNCTQFHRYEEEALVPYRYFKTFSGMADFADGQGEVRASANMYARDLGISFKKNFDPAIASLRAESAAHTAPLWRGRIESVRVSAFAHVCRTALAQSPWAFTETSADAKHQAEAHKHATASPPLRIALLGYGNVDMLRDDLSQTLSELLPGRRCEVWAVPFGTVAQQLLDPAGWLAGERPALAIFCDRLEDLAGVPALADADREALAARVRDHAAMIRDFHERRPGWTVVHRFAVHAASRSNDIDRETTLFVADMNRVLDTALQGLNQIVFVDIGSEAVQAGMQVHDPRLWYFGRLPFSQPFSRHLAKRWSAMLISAIGMSSRLIIVDLDNTLWGGVLGEDGAAGLKIGGDWPGNAYRAFQTCLRRLSARGIALAVVSKNDEDLALSALDSLPDMAIRSGDLAAHRINWRPKWQNIFEICEELSLGAEHVLFIDDNPVEREAVRRNLPAVKVLDLPNDPAHYMTTLMACPWIEALATTVEDLKRAAAYQARRLIAEERKSAASLDDFYASLGMVLHLQPLDLGNIARAAQLSVKTNQFNATTRRYDQSALNDMTNNGCDVVVIGLEDKYSARENIGLLILKADPKKTSYGQVDNFLMSCRVLGRGIETAVISWALKRAFDRGWRVLAGEIIETERNSPVRNIYADSGFRDGSTNGMWERESSNDLSGVPPWLDLRDGFDSRSVSQTNARRQH